MSDYIMVIKEDDIGHIIRVNTFRDAYLEWLAFHEVYHIDPMTTTTQCRSWDDYYSELHLN